MTRIAAALIVSLLVPTSARATSQTTDFSDLWWNPNEAGWGVNLIQQGDVIFLTMFVYGQNSQPTWYVGPATTLASSSGGILTFSGPLYATTGPWFGGPFNPANVTFRQVGSVAVAAGQVSSAAISYTVDGASVTKTIQRQSWRNDNVAGTYVGAVTGTYTNCGAARNGYFEAPVVLTVGHDGGSTFTMREEGSNYFCNYTGGYRQDGRMGSVSGNVTCSDGQSQTYAASEVQVSLQALTMRLVSQYANNCQFIGRIGGMRRAP